MKPLLCTALWALSLVAAAEAADTERQSEVSRLGAQVMPFSLQATTHVFRKSSDGGTQRVVVKNPLDTAQVELVRQHLHDMQGWFLSGDYSAPTRIHGAQMPGLAALKGAAPGQLAIAYRDVDGGAELNYRSTDTALVSAIHEWFDAQLADHGSDATTEHPHHPHAGMTAP